MPQAAQALTLSGGRRVDVREFGDPHGVPALYLHGTPSSSYEAHWLHAPALTHGVRILAVDRPGYGHSDPAPTASFEGVANVVVDAARALGLDRFAIIGFSGGAGFALAAAQVAHDSATVVHLGGGMGSFEGATSEEMPRVRRIIFEGAARAPSIAAPLLGFMGSRLGKSLGKHLALPTLAVLELFEGSARGAQLGAAEAYARSSPTEDLLAFVEGYMEGGHNVAAVLGDITAIVGPWGFELAEVRTRVELWHGTKDASVPLAYSKMLVGKLPNATLHELEGEGHFVLLSHGDEVCASVRARAQD